MKIRDDKKERYHCIRSINRFFTFYELGPNTPKYHQIEFENDSGPISIILSQPTRIIFEFNLTYIRSLLMII